jgi:hypothetical protein
MALLVKRWSQRRLLYPIAIFAIIAPTVVMGLFGAYALREIELRPSLYRSELDRVESELHQRVESRLSGMRLSPPRDEADLARLTSASPTTTTRSRPGATTGWAGEYAARARLTGAPT